MTYIPNDYWMICERCGAKYRYSEMRQEWTGSWVCRIGCWEPQHPQDFVESKYDDPSVLVARPDVANKMGETTLNGDVAKWGTTLILTDAGGLAEGDPIGIAMDNEVVHWTFITADPVLTTVLINDGLPWTATSGNAVSKPSIDNETWI